MRRAALLVVLCATLTACGGSSVLADTADNLDEIESATLSMTLLASDAEGREAGVELAGPFSFAEEGPLPVARIEVTRIAGERQTTSTFILTGQKAFVQTPAATYELPAERFGGTGDGEGGSGLTELQIGDWFEDPQVSDEGDNAERLEQAVRSSRAELLTGAEDHFLRRLTLEVDLGVQGSEALRSALGGLAGARLELVLALTNVNEPVQVEEPTGAEPYPGG
jgi:hypothetical protein